MSQRTTAVVLSILMAMSVLVPIAAAGSTSVVQTDTAATDVTVPEISAAASTDQSVDDSVRAVDTETAPPDPDNDTTGWENGYWHNESLSFDEPVDLSDEEIEAMAARAMARVEYIRGKEFVETTPVNVITREEYQQRRSGGEVDPAFGEWNNQVWEGLFAVGEDTDAQAAIAATTGSSVAGFYSPTRDEITIISDDPDNVSISPATLVHEYLHALQDQHFNLSQPRLYQGVDGTQDASLAVDGLVEGSANYVEARWDQRCGIDWSCLEEPGSGPGGGNANQGILYTIYNPYSDGPHYISQTVDEQGWEGVDRLYEGVPESTEQIIHVTDDPVADLPYEDTSTDAWSRFPDQGVNGADRLGEASIFTMFWANSVIDYGDISSGTDSRYDQLDYSATPSDGWGNDKLFPYKKGSGEDASYGYVWKTTWDSEQDAQEFRDAYVELLDKKQADRVGQRTWMIPDGPHEDAFHVVQNGTDVTIVNAPTRDELQEIRPGIEFEEPPETTTEEPPTFADTTTETTTAATTAETGTEPPEETTAATTTEADDDGGSGAPGMSALAALSALGLVLLWARQYRRQ